MCQPEHFPDLAQCPTQPPRCTHVHPFAAGYPHLAWPPPARVQTRPRVSPPHWHSLPARGTHKFCPGADHRPGSNRGNQVTADAFAVLHVAQCCLSACSQLLERHKDRHSREGERRLRQRKGGREARREARSQMEGKGEEQREAGRERRREGLATQGQH